jgi:hypothetical protein
MQNNPQQPQHGRRHLLFVPRIGILGRHGRRDASLVRRNQFALEAARNRRSL